MTNTVTHLAEKLVASYQQIGGINHLDGKTLPSRQIVTGITADLLRLLFPGFFDEKVIRLAEIDWETTAQLHSVLVRLEEELFKSLEYHPPEGAKKKDLRPLARSVAEELMGGLPCIRELLQTDVEAAFNGDPAALSREEVIVAYPCVEAVAVHRLAHDLYRKGIALVPRIMSEWAHSRTGMDIHPGATIGTHFFVDHCTGTVIGETSILGNHVKLYQGVALIARSLSGGQQLRGVKRHPTLEDRVTVYAGATIMGGDTVVGEGSTIGANVFLSHSVAPRSLVIAEDVKVKVMPKSERKPVDFQI